MLKIFGVTYGFTANYGSCLQAYALQSSIESIRIADDTVQYSLIPIGKSPGYAKSNSKGFKPFIKRMITNHSRKQFRPFEKKYMHYAPILPLTDFHAYNGMADGFVCGSDVIWNPKFNHGISEYFLSFAEKYSFSYAASFGQADVAESNFPKFHDLLSRLDSVSVREPKSAEIAKKCIDRDIKVSVDPVLLLNRDEWNRIAEKENAEGDYIFVYSVIGGKALLDFAKKLSEQTGLKVIFSGGNAGSIFKLGISRVQTPERWLQLVRDAKYVITDSFHGTVFSVLFHKSFFTIVKKGEGFSIRMIDFLKGIGLEDRLCSSLPDKIDCSEIDYREADVKLSEKIDRSKEYLRKNLEAVYTHKKP